MSNAETLESLKRRLARLESFPDQNPNPVLKVSTAGEVLYANPAAAELQAHWQRDHGSDLHPDLRAEAEADWRQVVEVDVGSGCYTFHMVPVPESGFANVYGTDLTALRAIRKFPDQNPNPVLKADLSGALSYANEAGASIARAWDLKMGDPLPAILIESGRVDQQEALELEVGEGIFSFHVVEVPEFECFNIYGTDISARKAKEEVMTKLAKYFSRQVYDSIFAGDLEVKVQTERKRLTVFFSDIKSFTELTERLEPEVLTELLTDYLSVMTEIAVKHGGTVDKYIGDAIMVFFGDPVSRGHQEDAVACVCMALEMRAALGDIRARWQKRGLSLPLDVRMGVHTGVCTVGNFGSRDRLDYTTVGNNVNLASRLETSAEANQILISHDTYLLVREAIRCRELGEIEVKNMKHPIQTYEALGHGSEAELLDAALDGFRVYVDPSHGGDVAAKRAVLERALALLEDPQER